MPVGVVPRRSTTSQLSCESDLSSVSVLTRFAAGSGLYGRWPDHDAQPGQSNSELVSVGSAWRNRNTKRVCHISRTGPCANLDGATRIWFAEEEAEWEDNGWPVGTEFDRCWELIPDAS